MSSRPQQPWLPPLALMLAATALIFAAGTWYYDRESQRIRAAKVEELVSIASLKTEQIQSWRNERLMDVGFGARSSILQAGLREHASAPESTREAVIARLRDFRDVFHYGSAMLVDASGSVRYAVADDEHRLATEEVAALPRAVDAGGAVLSEFFLVDGARPRVSAIAPVYDRGSRGDRPLGFLVLRRNPENLIFPLVRRWPTPSPSAESLLVSGTGRAIRFVPGLLSRETAGSDIAPGGVETASVRALETRGPLTVEGLDYRGAEVLARAEPVLDTRWVLVAKVDREEILAEVRHRGLAILGFMLLATLLAGVAVMLFSNRRQQRSDRALLAAERERHAALEAAGRSRLQLRGVIDATSDQIAAIDPEYRYIAFNRAYAEEFGRRFGERIAPQDSMLERLAGQPAELERARVLWGRALAGEQFTSLDEVGEPGAERRWLELAFSPIRDEHGTVIGAVHIDRDVTGRVRAEQTLAANEARLRVLVDERTRELVEARDLAESSNRIKDIFLATMSHELRTPLNSIIGFSDILLSGIAGEVNAEQRTQLGIIHKSGQQLLALISDVLDISKIEAGQLRLHLAPVALQEVLREQQRVFELLARDRGLEISFDYPAGPWPVVADAQRLRQVIGNLLSNALKFTDRGEVALRAERLDGHVRVTVRDTGIGIAPEEAEQLFQPFRRVAPRHGQNRDGTGLGLAISRRLVEAMNGRIGLESAPGQGSTFWFTLPLANP